MRSYLLKRSLRSTAIIVATFVALISGSSTVFAQTDLSVRSFNVAVTDVNEITISGELCNGTTPESVVVRLWLDRSDAPTPSSADSDVGFTMNFSAGACFSFRMPFADLPSGAHTAYIFVDAADDISEVDETNNQMSSSYAIDSFHDFSVTAMEIPSQINQVSTLKIPFAVKNTGSEDISDTGTRVSLGAKVLGTDLDLDFDVGGISLGIENGVTATLDGTADTSALTLGTYEVDVTVTNLLDLLEPVIFETSGSFSVVPAAATVGSLIWNDLNADGIQDSGEPGIPLVRVDLEEQGAGITATAFTNANGNYLIPGVPSGIYRPVVTLPQGYAFTSQDQGVDDTKDSDVDANGMGTFPAITSPATDDTFDAGLRVVPDIELISLTSRVDSSRLPTVSFQVTNNGAGVQTYRISVFNGRTTPPTCTSPGADYTEVVSLAPGEVLSRSLSPGLPPGAYTSYVFLDSDCSVAEGTETNNILSTAFTIERILPIPAVSFPGLALLAALMVTALTWLLWRRTSVSA